MDAAYLQEIVEGVLRVHVRHAVGLRPQGNQQQCNPFATVAVGPSAGEARAMPLHDGSSTHHVVVGTANA
jgi:hypothetical protein